ncbi:MAG: LysR family transcriptional regulator [Phycisphaerales bacterium]|nr:LysR family transcriptional regulator [Phycisphaerales bacterium]MBT7170280.1 LysR family transcriptional regulator [Phycisphaerales bacterium]
MMKTFCDLVDTGSFSRAAESNYISQSAVSQQVAKLEDELGVQLVARGGTRISATDAGKTFYQGAKSILRRYEKLLGEVKSVSDEVRGVLRVGTIYSVGFYLLDPYVRRFFEQHPEVDLHVTYTNWNHINAAILGGEMDLGVVACPHRDRSLENSPMFNEELVMVCPPEHRLAGRETISPSELEGESFSAFEENIPTQREIDRRLRAARVRVRVETVFDNIELLKRSLMVRGGVSILPRKNVEAEAERGDLWIATLEDDKPWTRPVAVLRKRGQAASPAEQKFLDILRSDPEEK